MIYDSTESGIEVIDADDSACDSVQVVPCSLSAPRLSEKDVSAFLPASDSVPVVPSYSSSAPPLSESDMSKNLALHWRPGKFAASLASPGQASTEVGSPNHASSLAVGSVGLASITSTGNRPSFVGQLDVAPVRSNQRSADVHSAPMFVDPAAMKAQLRQNMIQKSYDVTDFYKEEGIWQSIARDKHFEWITLSAISLNALWMWIDTDYNKDVLWEAPVIFQVVEHSFCAFYAFEWFVRFCSFKYKRDGLKDPWFVFDTALLCLTVIETWIVNFIMMALNSDTESGMGSTVILRMARLLRLSRMARMARLFRVMPEIMILIKGMVAACRSVLFTMFLLVIVLYIFGIAFTQLTSKSDIGQQYFNTVPEAMMSLLLYGTLLDEIGAVFYDIASEDKLYAGLFLIFVVLTSLTVMNMLIGILCEIVSAVAAVEREQMMVHFVKNKMEELLSSGIDQNGDRMISKEEFAKLLDNEQATACLQEVGVDVIGLVDMADFIFESEHLSDDWKHEDKELNFAEFMDIVLQLRGTNQATVKDLVDLRKYIRNKHKEVFKAVRERETKWRTTIQHVASEDSGSHPKGKVIKSSLEGNNEDHVSHVPPCENSMPSLPPLEQAQPLHIVEAVDGADPESTPELNNEALHNRMEKLLRLVDNGTQKLHELREKEDRVERMMTDASDELDLLQEVIERRSRIH